MSNTLKWHRGPAGWYNSAAPINGEAGAFKARIMRAETGWRLDVTTWDRLLVHAKVCPTLVDAKWMATRAYDNVEGVNR